MNIQIKAYVIIFPTILKIYFVAWLYINLKLNFVQIK